MSITITKVQRTYRISPRSMESLEQLCAKYGLSKSRLVEDLINNYAQSVGIDEDYLEEEPLTSLSSPKPVLKQPYYVSHSILVEAIMQNNIQESEINHSASLTSRLDALEQKVALLEKGRRLDKTRQIWMTGLCAALAFSVIGFNAKAAPKPKPSVKPNLSATSTASSKPGIITCTAIKIVGADGKPRVEIGDNNADVGYFVTEDKAGHVITKISSDSSGKGDIEALGNDSRPRVEFGVNPTDSGYMVSYGANGYTRARISTDTADNGALELMGTDNKDRVFSGVSSTGSGFVQGIGKEGNIRFNLTTDITDKGAFELRSIDGKDRIFMDINGTDSGQIETMAADGTLRDLISSDANDSGILHVENKAGKDQVVLTTNAKSGMGAVQINDASGAVKKTLPQITTPEEVDW